jgi:GT2 family glycosyltransferase
MSQPPAWLEDVDVAVVSHNGRHTLPRVLSCLRDAGMPPDRLAVYDIASTDDTRAWLLSEWPAARVVVLTANDGPNPARNRAIQESTRPFLLLVDSDAYLRPDAPTALRAAAGSDPSIGAVVPIVVHADEPDRIQYAGSRLHFLCEAITPWADRLVGDRGRAVLDIGTAPGVCFLLNVNVVRRVGLFDPRYFMGKEDGEFCFRLRLAGYRLLETPLAIAEHASRPRSTWLYPFQLRNRWHFMLKNYEARTLAAILPALLIHEPLQFLVLLAKGEGRAWLRGIKGLWPLLGSLSQDRRAARAIRSVHDRLILDAAPLVVRSDVTGSGAARIAKRLYDAWLVGYWRIVSSVLPR